MKQVVPDTSAVVDGRVSERVESGEFAGATVLVPEAVVSELEGQANAGRDTGWRGLEELQRLADLAAAGDVEVEYVGRRPDASVEARAREGEVDAVIRDVAADNDAVLVTSDKVQSEVARAKGIEVEYVAPKTEETQALRVAEFFDDRTMSVHLKAGVVPMAKRGDIGDIHYQPVADDPLSEAEADEYAKNVLKVARRSSEGFVEFDKPGMAIVQIRDFRIAVARPPFSDAVEITAVRPLVKTDLEDYEFADELKERLLERERGVLISGSPGAGKSTFAQSVAEFLASHDYVVKTMEKPRDLQVGSDITQYTELDGTMENTADALLMVRPDYTIYDEVRKTSDFQVFADMRMAGVGMVGVVHATRAIDALQRLIGRVELGMIPQVSDTVVYIEDGEVETVYDVQTKVKVPAGLMEADLARPVITVTDFETGTPEYEIYTFNQQVVTVPLETEDGESGVDRLAKQEIEREIQSLTRGPVHVDIKGSDEAVVYVDEGDISYVIGKGGGRISDIEDRLGISIDVRTHAERPGGRPDDDDHPAGEIVTPEVTSRHVIVPMEGRAGETVEVRADAEYLFTATVGRGGDIKVSRGSAIAEELERAIDHEKMITVVPS